MGEIDQEVEAKWHEWQFERHAVDARSRLDFADQFAHSGLKSLFFINGGAIVSLLTMIGNAHTTFNSRGVFWAFVWFSAGLSASLMANFGGYFCQNYFMLSSEHRAHQAKAQALKFNDAEFGKKGDDAEKTGNLWIKFAIGSAALSFCLFVIGAFVALVAIT